MQHYRIFVSETGGFQYPSKYEFVAEFPSQESAANYVRYMKGKKRYFGKDMIIKVVSADGFSAEDGQIDAVISALGELIMEGGHVLI